MKGILELLRLKSKPSQSGEPLDSVMFSTAFAVQGVEPDLLVPWEARTVEVAAAPFSTRQGIKLLQGLWAKDKFMSQLAPDAIARLAPFLQFSTLATNRDIIRQDEYGNFMLVLLSGRVAIDRQQPWGERLRLAEAVPGEILGEMSLLDSGIRFSTCTTLVPSEVAVLDAQAMDDMLRTDPALAANLIALLARKLSLRLRVVSARLSEHH